MRKGQRFTPARLVRWHDSGRGTGTGADYQPWHQVTRDDPSSRGRSHLLNWRFGRLHHLLSDLELVAFGFASMLTGVVDLREQFPLARDEHLPELATYQVDSSGHLAPGTLEIADTLGHRHPLVRKGDDQEPWVMSTDFLLTLRNRMGRLELLAISVKSAEDLKNERKLQLLRIEREYWRHQDVFWLLLTPALYAPLVANSIRIGMPWTIGQPDVREELVSACAAMSNEIRGRTAVQFLDLMGSRLCLDSHAAQCVMWQCIWSGALPVNLSRPLRLGEPLELLSPAEFWRQNPIASRRTAWSH
ncbi:TnsA endonuclease N-terminal domain-containing protein [Hydrogenophaga sp. PAMC20947]|uniref:TnsA endonuclease N-terminal domain-containing protein n=1 Tax=Hydrogenophaga sp. PAMC20947 TaxID=2565558 RepID=UPI001446E1B8|nr:TnsA endonuclease N-terminal domain-containing protein [Hydrogenophaga sp. PAMC20947]